MIFRNLNILINKRLHDKKAIIILGPRQAGKTTLLKQIIQSIDKKVLWLNGDNTDVREMFENTNSSKLRLMIGKNEIIVIDEAQRIKNIGLCLKIIIDEIPDVKVLASGSSAFELANEINEPLTGRKWEFILYPLSYSEMVRENGLLEERRMLQHRMVYGYYPDVVINKGDEKEILNQLSSSYLYKDILTWENIQKPEKLEKLVQALAFQIGNEVSYNELGSISGLDNETVERYINLLEKAFIIFRLSSFNRNLRNELKKSRKIYFFDNGLRNALINQFNTLNLRNDAGALWENFMVSERLKYISLKKIYANRYFWRTLSQQEIDYIEDYDGIIHAYEFKWNENKSKNVTKTFANAYPNHTYQVISPSNYESFIMDEL